MQIMQLQCVLRALGKVISFSHYRLISGEIYSSCSIFINMKRIFLIIAITIFYQGNFYTMFYTMLFHES